MNGNRALFLGAVREAVSRGNRLCPATKLPSLAAVPRSKTGTDLLLRFGESLRAAGGAVYLAANRDETASALLTVLSKQKGRRVILGSGKLIDSMAVASALVQSGFECIQVRDIKQPQKEAFFAADVGISQADCLVAETGSIFVRASPQEPRSLSLLPPVHVVLTQASAVVGDLFDVFAGPWAGPDALPTSMVLITGPSKTGDIELRLVTGVHGPGEVHVILLTTPP